MHWLVGIPALIFALYFAGCEVVGTYEYLHTDQGGMTYIVAAGCGIAAALAVLPGFAAFAWRAHKSLSSSLWALFVAALAIVMMAGVARTGTAADTAQVTRTQTDVEIADSRRAVEMAEDDVNRADAQVYDARAALAKASPQRTCTKACIDGLTRNVVSAQTEATDARKRLDDARRVLLETRPAAPDSMSKRLAALLPWASEDRVRLYQPIAVPVITSALSAALMSLAVWCFGPYRLQRKESARLAQMEADQDAEPLEAEDVDEIEDAEEPAAKRLALVGPGSALAGFATDHIERADGEDLSMRDVLAAYEAECDRDDVEPLDRPTFARELAALCRLTGIAVRVEGKNAYLVNARLAA